MRTRKELETAIEKLEGEIDTRNDALQKAELELAHLLCPFKVGDKVEDKNGKIAVVSKIKSSCWQVGYEIEIKKIKKDGDLHANAMKAYDWDEWKLYKPEGK